MDDPERQFYALVATLIPVFLLTGAVTRALRPAGRDDRDGLPVVAVSLVLPLLFLLLATAETVALVGVVDGELNRPARLLLIVALLVSIAGVVVALARPWWGHVRSGFAKERFAKFLAPVAVLTTLFFLYSAARLIDSVLEERAFNPGLASVTNLDRAHTRVREQLRRVNEDRRRLAEARQSALADGEVTKAERRRLFDERTLLAMDEGILRFHQTEAIRIRAEVVGFVKPELDELAEELDERPLTKEELRILLGGRAKADRTPQGD